MKKTRILFDNLYVKRGGAEVFMTNLIDYLPRDRYDITVAATYWDKRDPDETLPAGVHFIKRFHRRKNYKRLSPLWVLDRVYGRVYDAVLSLWLSLLHFDIAVAVQEKMTMYRTDAIRAKRKFGWIHTDYTSRLPLSYDPFPSPEAERACMARFEKVVCVSETARQGILKTLGDPGNLVVCYNPIDVKRIRALAAQPCPLHRSAERPLLVSVGRLVAEKNYLLFLEACARLRRHLAFDVWLIGDGEERPALEAYMAAQQLDFVHLLGTQVNPFPYLRQADLFVSSSQTEGYGLAVQEALILGVPVAAVSCPGIAESLDTRFGILSENSAAALADAIAALLAPQTLAEYRQRIAAEYPADTLFEKRLESICALWE